jgi:hypothetical protein
LLAALLLACSLPQAAQAQGVRITKLSDVNFGTIANLQVNNQIAQSICVFSNSTGRRYNVRAVGSGGAGAFTLAGGPFTLAYDVLWNQTSGQTNGTQLTPNVTLTGLASVATQRQCNSGPPTSASLIVLLRGTTLSQARQGSYTGTLSITIAPE